MASLAKDRDGSKRILFVHPGDRRRRTLRLPAGVSTKDAEAALVRVERLVSALAMGCGPDAEVSRWVAGLTDVMHGKLVTAGLVEPRQSATLGGFIAEYLTGRAADLKPRSLMKLEQTGAKLKKHFGESRVMRTITPGELDDWRAWLLSKGGVEGGALSLAMSRTHAANAKQFWRAAVRRRVLSENAAEGLAAGTTSARLDRFVTAEEAEAVIEACPDIQWKMLFGLARFAGLRVPSEISGLTWADLDFDRGLLRVRSPKTERYAGHAERTVPVGRVLLALMAEGLAAAAEGDPRVITLNTGGGLYSGMGRIVKRSGVASWKKTYQTLRASAEADWAAAGVPAFVTAMWAGHSLTVAGKHYLTFDHAGSIELITGRKAERERVAQIPAQHTAQRTEKEANRETLAFANPLILQGDSGSRSNFQKRVKGVEPSTFTLAT